MDCGSRFVKILLFIFNFVFVVCGLTLIGLGAVTMTIYKDSTKLLGPSFTNAPIAIIVAGVIIFIVAFLGCCGAIQENRILLIIFGLCLIILLVTQIVLAITIYFYRAKINDIISKSMTDAMKAYQTSNDTITHILVDKTQQAFKCCGVNGTLDWGSKIPPSCCLYPIHCNSTLAFPQGCLKVISTQTKSQIGILAGLALVVCLIEILGMVLAFFLSKSIAEEYERV